MWRELLEKVLTRAAALQPVALELLVQRRRGDPQEARRLDLVPTRERQRLSDRGLLAGVTIPLDTAVRLNKSSGVDAESFSGVTLEA